MIDRLSAHSTPPMPHIAPRAGRQRRQVAEKRTGSGHLKSRVIKRSVVVAGHKTSVSLEDVFWNALRDIAHNRGVHLSQLVGSIDQERQHGNLSSAIRLFVFEQCRNHAPDSDNRAEGRSDHPDLNCRRQPGAAE
jgi:predicted DNA-binding ribbon-helix-helix protein